MKKVLKVYCKYVSHQNEWSTKNPETTY
jgi:hypothetical protein